MHEDTDDPDDPKDAQFSHQEFDTDIAAHIRLSDKIASLDRRTTILYMQLKHITSQVQSEKGTRSRGNQTILKEIKDMDTRLRIVEKSIWTGFGILIMLEILLRVIHPQL